jgi:hypothetical protein
LNNFLKKILEAVQIKKPHLDRQGFLQINATTYLGCSQYNALDSHIGPAFALLISINAGGVYTANFPAVFKKSRLDFALLSLFSFSVLGMIHSPLSY